MVKLKPWYDVVELREDLRENRPLDGQPRRLRGGFRTMPARPQNRPAVPLSRASGQARIID